MHCILIDDDQDDIDIFKFALDDLNLDIDFKGFTDFNEALNALSIKQPEYIFLDGFMNVISGKEALQKIKSNKTLSTIPVIIYSGFLSDNTRKELLELGAFDIFIKSNSVDELKVYLQKLVSV